MLSTLPPEILEEIGFATISQSFSSLSNKPSSTFLGPPSALLPLLLTNRQLHACLCLDSNPVLYARIFELQFDSNVFATRRLSAIQDAQVLANELKRRWVVLGRMRAGIGSKFQDVLVEDSPARPQLPIEELVSLNRSTLATAYALMLENTSGKNAAQLCGYGNARKWLQAFLFNTFGASGANRAIMHGSWPVADDSNLYSIRTEAGEQLYSGDGEANTLALWLFWFLFRADDYPEGPLFRTVTSVLKLFALAAHHFPLTSPSWADFIPASQPMSTSMLSNSLPSHYPPLIPPPAATPAILAFLALVGSPSVGLGIAYAHVGRYHQVRRLPDTEEEKEEHDIEYARPWTSCLVDLEKEAEWESEWGRCVRGGRFRVGSHHAARITGKVDISSVEPVFKRGSVEGVWEGMFTYLEFTAYSALLSGSPPSILQRSLVVRHRQTWKLREWWLMASEDETTDEVELQDSWFSGGIVDFSDGHVIDGDIDSHVEVQLKRPSLPRKTSIEEQQQSVSVPRLAPGPALRSYIPLGTRLTESSNGSELEVCEPAAGSLPARELVYQRATVPTSATQRIRDVIITGEGHSAWGQFSLAGRVRPCDGFICLTKEYTDGDRGRWLYRGFLVGDSRGALAGRWRDTLSPAEVQGYEGCFTMSRRQ